MINGDRGQVLAISEDYVDVELDRGGTVRLPAHYAQERHLDHGYAITAHKAQGATVDRAFVLGSDEAYREWGYTAMSRHRDSATFYVTEPADFINVDAQIRFTCEELIELATKTFDTSRRHELAIEAMQHDPDLSRLLPDLSTYTPCDAQPPGPARDPLERDGWIDRAGDLRPGPDLADGLDMGM